ncbi:MULTISPECIES: twin-arginine translocase subunit TatC [unclassified Mucilaginibacter]|uniref:twin-arginine translocase subunit TatC n=1 Tax=unclassified Mucilaginibacter TaxID=2617802 RepID=UPI002AC9D665|nr:MULTISPECIES: twin-arginine translocase subunit TatC [unclassified Mucilaginibacter]MEB0262011.1 twin-arginine translocase subunit TatC [Mucilaginibacter sp. 10I4]MEB0279725.1 twin-arginine translocase subunit TatC [Mucilaginibacter sp. 10B2]MEB0301682.1 twin-arginine translocase subunit TatC [Mucilaginibacter sp. 5C4]WPX23716.1 twin-arginine translocase subunit TatC [Mucilaginibacter sp. 5C4]
MSDNKLIKAIKEKGQTMEAEMSFFDHLEALRWHLVRAAIAIVIFTCGAFYFYDFIFDTVIMGPSKPSFWTYRMLCKLGEYLHRDGFCINKINISLLNTEMAGQFTLQINSALLIGITLGFPYLLWELWRFIRPALHEKERKAASGFVIYATFLFIVGVLFGYYVITPESINFLAGYTVSTQIENKFSIDSYLSSVATLTLATGIVFELPILVYVLSSLGVLTVKFMRETRRYAVVVILIIAAVVTPTPDMLTMTIVSIPLFILYEIGILVAGVVEKRKKAREATL